MTPDDAIATADEVLQASQHEPLTDIQRMILRESMAGTGYEKMEGYTTQHIKNEGKKLWDLLTQVLGETVSKKNFKGALEKRWRSGQVVLKPPSLSVYKPETWVGRSQLIEDLLPKLQDKTRAVWMTGIPGIGKTTLGECLASRAWDVNPSFQWVYLEVLEGQGADFTTIAAELLGKLGETNLDPQERNDPKRLTDRLIRKLQSSFYWIQLDSLERLLNPEQGTEFSDPHWVTFLQRCLTEADFGSRLVLTAQALPGALVEFGDRYSNVWQARTLSGLSVDDQRNEHLEFFDKHGVAVNDANRETLCKLGQVYEGHTLVLQVMSGEIQADFDGDVLRYWSVNQSEFEQVTRSLDSKRLDETEYNDELDRRVRDRVKKSLQQLPTDAQDLLLRSSVYRRPVPKKFWLAMIDDRSVSQQKEAYRVLCDRALVEKEGANIRQHNLIRDVVNELLQKTIMYRFAARKAAQLWIFYEPPADATNLESIQRYLEAFEHYVEAEDYQTAIQIPGWIVKPQIPLHWQLYEWSYFKELILLSSKTLSISQKIGNSKTERDALCDLGISYVCLGDYSNALKYHVQYLKLVTKTFDYDGIMCGLGNLSEFFLRIHDYESAKDCAERQLEFSYANKYSVHKCQSLTNLGTSYLGLGEYLKAIEQLNIALNLSCQRTDKKPTITILTNLSTSYRCLNKFEIALKYSDEAMDIARKNSDSQGEQRILEKRADIYYRQGENEQSIICLQDALRISCEIGNLIDRNRIQSSLDILRGESNEPAR